VSRGATKELEMATKKKAKKAKAKAMKDLPSKGDKNVKGGAAKKTSYK
jgi:hypothetical protein